MNRRKRRKLASKLVEFLSAPGPKRMDVWDAVLQRFGVRMSATGRKAWFVVVRPDGSPKRVTIGTHLAISLADAREQAGKITHDVQLGVFEKPTEPETPTLGETVSLFIQLYAKPNNRGWKDTERLLGDFQALFSKPIDTIKRGGIMP